MAAETEYTVCFLGDAKVGKSAIIRKLTTGVFAEDYNSIDIYISQTNLNGFKYKFIEYKDDKILAPESVNGLVIVVDLNNDKWLQSAAKWVNLSKSMFNQNIPVILLFNKSEYRACDPEVMKLVKSHGFNVSAYVSVKHEYDHHLHMAMNLLGLSMFALSYQEMWDQFRNQFKIADLNIVKRPEDNKKIKTIKMLEICVIVDFSENYEDPEDFETCFGSKLLCKYVNGENYLITKTTKLHKDSLLNLKTLTSEQFINAESDNELNNISLFIIVERKGSAGHSSVLKKLNHNHYAYERCDYEPGAKGSNNINFIFKNKLESRVDILSA